ncbi:MAG: hypothetical protein IBJ11_07490, partial [Phycisphaerales bacterium]|nr:hypothetical protein [Phycisphaerales bacterium]
MALPSQTLRSNSGSSYTPVRSFGGRGGGGTVAGIPSRILVVAGAAAVLVAGTAWLVWPRGKTQADAVQAAKPTPPQGAPGTPSRTAAANPPANIVIPTSAPITDPLAAR